MIQHAPHAPAPGMPGTNSVNYFNIANDNFYYYFAEDYHSGRIAHAMTFIAHETCQLYLKSIILKYDKPKSDGRISQMLELKLNEHSLAVLVGHITEHLQLPVEQKTVNAILAIDDFGEHIFPPITHSPLTHYDMDLCYCALNACRDLVYSLDEQLSVKPSDMEEQDELEQEKE